MEKANYSNKDVKLKLEGLNLNIDKEVLDDQRALKVSTEVPDKEKVSKDDKVDFENFKVLYADAIKDKCLKDFGVDDDKKLLEDTAKEMYLASKTYIPEEDRKADGEIEKKTENKKIVEEENPFKVKYKAMLNGKEVKPGDKIKDFRGDEHIFKGITNPGTPFGGRNGKVCVDFGDGSSVEYYPSVFNIELVRVDESKKVTESIDEEELNDVYNYLEEADELAEKLYDTWNSIPSEVRGVLDAQYTDNGISGDITTIREAISDFANDWNNVKDDIITQLDESKSIKKECPKQC